MKKEAWLLIVGLWSLSGCQSLTSPTPSPAVISAAKNQAAKDLVRDITGNAKGARDKSRVLYDEAEALRQARDYDGAMDKRLQIIEVRGAAPSTFNALTAYAMQQLALYRLSSIAANLSAASARKYAAKMKTINAAIPSYTALLQRDKANKIGDLSRYTSKPGEWPKMVAGLGFGAKDQASLKKLTPAQVKANIAKFYDAKIKLGEQPYAPTEAIKAADPYTAYITKSTFLNRFLWAKNKTERLFVIVALERKADYEDIRTGTKPVGTPPTYVLPLDPFGTGPFKTAGGHVYSVGPDTLDDLGRRAAEPVRFNSKGDMIMPLFSPMRHDKVLY
jgi:hypothetical protein